MHLYHVLFYDCIWIEKIIGIFQYLPDDSTRPFWEGDPCSQEPLPDVDLLTSEFEVVWAPPPNPNHTKGRTFIITAIGNGKHSLLLLLLL